MAVVKNMSCSKTYNFRTDIYFDKKSNTGYVPLDQYSMILIHRKRKVETLMNVANPYEYMYENNVIYLYSCRCFRNVHFVHFSPLS